MSDLTEKRVNIRLILITLIATMILAYVIGGVVFAFDQALIHNKIFVCLVLLISLESSCIGLFFLFRNKLGFRSFISARIDTAGSRKRFGERYNLCRIDLIIVAIICAVGGVARIIGYDWGKVASWQPDERKLTDAPINMVNYLTPYLDNVYYPNQFISKPVAVLVYIVRFFFGCTVDTNRSVWVIFLFRIVVAICGTITIYVAFLLGNYFKRHLGCIFAALVATYPYYINLSKQVTGDVTALLFLSLLMLYSIRYMEEYKDVYLATMCACAAAATLEKWHGAVGIGFAGVLLLFCCENIKDYVIRGIKAVGLYIMWLLIFAPNIVVRPVQTIRDGFINIAVYNDYEHPPYFTELFGYFQHGYRYVFGIAGILLLIWGLYCLIMDFNKKYLVLLLGLLKIMCLGFLNRSFARWGFEFYFSGLFVISLGIYYAVFECSGINAAARRFLTVVVPLCATIMLTSMIVASYLSVLVAVSDSRDTRLLQREDCRRLGIAPEAMTSQYYSGFAPASRCDSEYPDNEIIRKKDWNDYFVVDDNVVFRTQIQPDYVCLCPSYNAENYKMSETLDHTDTAKRILEYDSVCSDTFFIPFIHNNDTLNDFKLIKSNIDIIKQIRSGALTGLDIVVYDVSRMPVI